MINKHFRNLFFGLSVLLTSSFTVYAQAELTSVPMADTFRSEGKIYVVVGSFVLIMAGLLIFLVLTERRVGRLENDLKQKSKR